MLIYALVAPCVGESRVDTGYENYDKGNYFLFAF